MDFFVQELFTSRSNHANGSTRLGQKGRIWYDAESNSFRVGDGVTPGGILISGGVSYGGGGASGSFDFNVAADDSTQRTINSGETVQFRGTNGITTASDSNGVITITGPNLSGYQLTSSAFNGDYNNLSNKPTIPSNTNQLTNGAGYITASALSEYATETYVTTRGYITTSALSTYALSSSVPTDLSQLTDNTGLLGQSGEGGTTYITNNVENPYAFNVAGDDSTLREISNGETLQIVGATGITVSTDAEGKFTVTGPNLSAYALSSSVPSDLSQLTDNTGLLGQGGSGTTYVTNNIENLFTFSVAGDDSTLREISNGETLQIVGATGVTVTSDQEGKITITGPDLSSYSTFGGSYNDLSDTPTLITSYNDLSDLPTLITSYNDLSDLPTLFSGSYNDLTNKPTLSSVAFSGSWNDITDKPNLAGTYSFSVAADDSTQIEISTGNLIKFRGAGGITTSSDADGTITITSPANNAINANGTLSMPVLTSAPSNLQMGQIALANGTTWDPLVKTENLPYMIIWTGSIWTEIGGTTMKQVYSAVLEMG